MHPQNTHLAPVLLTVRPEHRALRPIWCVSLRQGIPIDLRLGEERMAAKDHSSSPCTCIPGRAGCQPTAKAQAIRGLTGVGVGACHVLS